jgi:hypothetical protein
MPQALQLSIHLVSFRIRSIEDELNPICSFSFSCQGICGPSFGSSFRMLYRPTTFIMALDWPWKHVKHKHFLAHFVYKIKIIFMCFKLWIQIMDVITLYTNGFLLIFKIYFHNNRRAPSHLFRVFFRSPQANARMLPQIWPRPFLYTSFPVY